MRTTYLLLTEQVLKNMVALVGKETIGDDINKKILHPLQEVGNYKISLISTVNQLGSGKEMIDTLSKLILIF
jgi:type I restriction enzyme M protein